jgi:hypothetical protein
VVGMCFTGGFALAMMVDDIVLAPVLSQPSLPFPLSKKHKADIGISDADLARIKERTAEGAFVVGLRFSNDPFCFQERFATFEEGARGHLHRRGDRLIGGQSARPPEVRAFGPDRAPPGSRRYADPGRPRSDVGVPPGEAGGRSRSGPGVRGVAPLLAPQQLCRRRACRDPTGHRRHQIGQNHGAHAD